VQECLSKKDMQQFSDIKVEGTVHAGASERCVPRGTKDGQLYACKTTRLVKCAIKASSLNVTTLCTCTLILHVLAEQRSGTQTYWGLTMAP